MIEEILRSNRRLRIEHKNILSEADAEGLKMLELLSKYLSDYCKYFQLNAEQTQLKYANFIEDYVSNFKAFNLTNLYPHETGKSISFDRVTYDIALILSVFFIPARYKIFRELLNLLETQNGKILIIGVGAAIELELIYKLFPNKDIEAYDLSISTFVKERFAEKKIFEKEFIFNSLNQYQNILAIELLEHLSEPLNFVLNCSKSLIKKGNMFITTASNMPQFDHLFNFHGVDFDKQLSEIGFSIESKLKLPHPLLNKNIESYNTFYHLIKN